MTDKKLKELDIGHAFMFIPDMSGFTRFITKSNSDFSRRVIPALLENIIEGNILGMNVAEIQGDAILFYKLGPPPDIHHVARQAKQTFLQFEMTLQKLAKEAANDPQSFLSASALGLKIVVHYGEVAMAEINGNMKLMGEDVIIAHRLLKNKIPQDDYLLLSEKYLRTQDKEGIKKALSWRPIESDEERYEHLGVISYSHITLKPFAEYLIKKNTFRHFYKNVGK